jgi:hypothetical protein
MAGASRTDGPRETGDESDREWVADALGGRYSGMNVLLQAADPPGDGRDSKDMSRRRFLKATAVGALAMGAVPTIIVPRRAEAFEGGAKIHPEISPLRVAGIRDPKMIRGEAVPAMWADQEKLVDWDAVSTNMDRVAMKLAEESAAADAWKKIIVKPAGKSWSDVVVAIKTNNIAEQHTRSAVMSKLCHVLIDTVGVKPSNIYIYDACHGGDLTRKSPFAMLPAGVNVAGQWGSYKMRVDVPAPYLGGDHKAECLDHLVKGDVDILINLALCKGHSGQFGRFTGCMKNHFGTFNPGLSHQGGGGADYLIGINKSPLVLGDLDPGTGNVLFPRQQLCLVDALWGSDPGPGGPPTAQLNSIIMGTCCPVTDYVVATHLRRDIMGWSVNEQVARRMLTEFGFSPSDLPNGGKIIDAGVA